MLKFLPDRLYLSGGASKSLLTICLLIFVCASHAQADTITTSILPGEKWWGALDNFRGSDVKAPQDMPYDENTCIELDLYRQSYGNQCVPFLVSTKGRYFWCDSPVKLRFDKGVLTVESTDRIEFKENLGNLRRAFLDAAGKHFPGNGQMPPQEFLRSPQYNTWIELMYDQNQADILKYAKGIVNNGFPVDAVLMVDDNWQKYYGNFEFKPERFPDAKAMSDELHRMGFKIMLWVCPFVSPDCPEYRMLAKKGYLIKTADGKLPAVIKWWNGQSAAVDLSNPEAREWLRNQLLYLQRNFGIDGFKFDAGDANFYDPDRIKVYDDKSYGALQTQLWAELGEGFPYNEFRACWKMAGKPLVQRLHDKIYTWGDQGVAYLLPAMLASSMTGHLFVCPDMIGGGGYSAFINLKPGDFDQDLIVRSCQIHALMPMMQFSVAPWRVLDEQHLECCRRAAKLHTEFSDYIVETCRRGSVSGEPVIRPMEYEFPGEGFESVLDQFMLGDKYLVAPMTTQGYSRTVKLPKGLWQDDLGRRYNGGRTYDLEVPIERLPYFERLR